MVYLTFFYKFGRQGFKQTIREFCGEDNRRKWEFALLMLYLLKVL